MSNPLISAAEENESKIFSLLKLNKGRLNYEIKDGSNSDLLEIKVFNEDAKLGGIVWFFGHRRAYIQDVRNLVERKKKQNIAFFLIAGDGTTSAGKKELKVNGIELVRNLDDVKATSDKKRKKKKQARIKTEEVSIDDDVTLQDSSPILAHAKNLLQKNEPEIIKMVSHNFSSYEATDLRGYTSNNELIAVVRTIDLESIGVSQIREYFSDLGSETDGITATLVGDDKFTPSARKEASSYGINLNSIKDYAKQQEIKQDENLIKRLSGGVTDMLTHLGYSFKKRKDKDFISIETGPDNLGTYLYSENEEGENILALIPTEDVVRVATIRAFVEQKEKLGIDQAWIIAVKRFTYTADREASANDVKLLKKNHPIFNIFNHPLVPEHQLMNKHEIKAMLIKYNAKLHQLPRIYKDDHGAVAINAQIGDVIRILRTEDSHAYRIVIPRPEPIT